MGALRKDELGFLRASSFSRVRRQEIEHLLEVTVDEQVYLSTYEGGVRTAKPLESTSEISVKSGDMFCLGPRITKAAELPEQIRKEADALSRAGFGSIGKPVHTEWGWQLELKGMILPGGMRTDALVLLPKNYPLASPIGFYVRRGAKVGKLDPEHIFPNSAHHGAENLSKEGWQWFCGIAEGWKPNRHTIVSYISMVFSLFNDKESA